MVRERPQEGVDVGPNAQPNGLRISPQFNQDRLLYLSGKPERVELNGYSPALAGLEAVPRHLRDGTKARRLNCPDHHIVVAHVCQAEAVTRTGARPDVSKIVRG